LETISYLGAKYTINIIHYDIIEFVNWHFEDFTESEYRKALKIAKTKWEFITFTDYQKTGSVCLWRHDLDVSVHRAYCLAQIEAEEEVKTTYFIHLHNTFYNPFEREIFDLIFAICELGHTIGLHFDPNYYGAGTLVGEGFSNWLQFERNILEKFFQTQIHCFSLHNPDVGDWLDQNQDEVNGMVNAYGQYIRTHYAYVSDSNGYWRFRRLNELVEGTDEKIHVLTHPGFWTPEPMSPRARISRAIDGRAAKQHRTYDQFLEKHGRKNIL
jgi:hypothetical protein